MHSLMHTQNTYSTQNKLIFLTWEMEFPVLVQWGSGGQWEEKTLLQASRERR